MKSSTYKFNLKKGGQVKVRFYESGIFTVVDSKNCEHEAGMWEKKYLEEDGKVLKTYFHYEGCLFGVNYKLRGLAKRDLAMHLLDWWSLRNQL